MVTNSDSKTPGQVDTKGKVVPIPLPDRYEAYKSEMAADLAACMEDLSCQPILFIGSGLSRRYFGAPSWDELLRYLADKCPLIDKALAYYRQSLKTSPAIGQLFAERFQEWAWSSGRREFPDELFDSNVAQSTYLKYFIAQHLDELTPTSINDITDGALRKELEALQAIRPHAIITTNYDKFLELVFPEYQPVIGQEIIRGQSLSVGEVFKIHGCTSRPASLVFTQDDYDEFAVRKKYLSAKLLTFFSEHPLIFIGYSASDPNIQAILADIDEALPEIGGIIPNVYVLEWKPSIPPGETPAREKLIAIGGNKGVRIKAIETTDFGWPFQALGSTNFNPKVSPKTLRALMSRSYELVRTDIPRKTVEANFEMLEHALGSPSEFAKLFGISTITDPSVISAKYPYTLTNVAKLLGFNKGWSGAQKLLDRVRREKGLDIKAGDNRYHCTLKYGVLPIHKYSDELVVLLKLVRAGKDYECE
jgi:hypothetical protein